MVIQTTNLNTNSPSTYSKDSQILTFKFPQLKSDRSRSTQIPTLYLPQRCAYNRYLVRT